MSRSPEERSLDRKIWAYALPSLATLIAQPLLLTADTTMVGRLGTTPLAGLALASTLLGTLVGLCIFLTYATTAATGKLFGAGDRAGAARQGIEGLWLAAGIGAALALVLAVFAQPIVAWFGAEPAAAGQAVRYLRASAPGLPGMLVVLAATGTLRGFGDTKRPLYAATSGALANIPVNYVLIYPAGLGVAGAGAGTALVETAMGAWLTLAIVRIARQSGASLTPSRSGTLSALNQAWPLVLRTACLRAAIIVQIATATHIGVEALAANQIAMTIWNFAANGLDCLAIAAQILVSNAMGAKSVGAGGDIQMVLGRCLRFGVLTGAGLGLALACSSALIPAAMTADGQVRALAMRALITIGCCLPIASVAYILDGVLMGAQDTRRLAWYMLVSLATFAPLAAAIFAAGGSLADSALLVALWIAYGGLFMAVRGGTMLVRSRSGEPFE
ncbi:MAG: MATE family efflux transporter [Actinomycetaceae bacterium]|nr:MATE family efflux transporter [Actinomycetaceae bacterium]